jgi:hypothetical protein
MAPKRPTRLDGRCRDASNGAPHDPLPPAALSRLAPRVYRLPHTECTLPAAHTRGRECVCRRCRCVHARLPRPAAAAPATFAPLPHCPPPLAPHLARSGLWPPRGAPCTFREGVSRCWRQCRTSGPKSIMAAPGRPVSRLGCLDTPNRYTLLRGGPRQPPAASSPASSLLPDLRRCVVCGVADTQSHLAVPGARQRTRAHPPCRSRVPHGVSTPEPYPLVPQVRCRSFPPPRPTMNGVWRR